MAEDEEEAVPELSISSEKACYVIIKAREFEPRWRPSSPTRDCLIALAWIGRGDFTKEEWQAARALAEERHRRHSANYLIGMPTLGHFLEEGLAALGRSCEEYEAGRL